MKNDRKTDLSLLENAEDRTLNRMTECYAAASDKDKERIYRISEKMYKRKLNTYNRKNKGIVSGVERYNRPKWYKSVMTAAACLVLAGGIVGSGILLFNSSKNVVPQTENKNTTNTAASETTEVTTIAEETEFTTTIEETEPSPNPKFRELQLHEIPYADSEEEAKELVKQHMIECKFDERYGVDVEHYVEQLRNSDDLNTLENKSYIYHMMLNSIDYFSTAQGSGTDQGTKFEFKEDLANHKSCSKIRMEGSDIEKAYNEEYYLDNFEYDIYNYNDYDPDNKSVYEKVYCGYFDYMECYPEDNYRLINLTDSGREYYSFLSISNDQRLYNQIHSCGSSFLYPYSMAENLLLHFDKWNINVIEEYNGRECALISGEIDYNYNGTHEDVNYNIYVDIHTGIMMYYSESNRGTIMKIDTIEIDAPCEISLPDLSGFDYVKTIYFGSYGRPIPFDELEYPVNENDQTYGTIEEYKKLKSKSEFGKETGYFPDLLKVTGDNGKEGYVLTEECLHKGNFAVFTNNPLASAGYDDFWDADPHVSEYVLKVYESDGVTQVDTYTLVRG